MQYRALHYSASRGKKGVRVITKLGARYGSGRRGLGDEEKITHQCVKSYKLGYWLLPSQSTKAENKDRSKSYKVWFRDDYTWQCLHKNTFSMHYEFLLIFTARYPGLVLGVCTWPQHVGTKPVGLAMIIHRACDTNRRWAHGSQKEED